MAHDLLKGFKKFRQAAYGGRVPLMKKLLSEGQDPDYFIISCIDSRSNPATIFKSLPGTFFAFKAMGAIVRPHKMGTALSAALQFALNYNKVKEIIVLGHTSCGAIKALVANIEDQEIASFIDVAHKGFDKARHRCHSAEKCDSDDLQRYAEEEIVLLSCENLRSYPSVRKALDEGRLKIRPWIFDMTQGVLLEYDQKAKAFVKL